VKFNDEMLILASCIYAVWFQKIFLPTPRRVIGNCKGEMAYKKKQNCKRKYEQKLEFPERLGAGVDGFFS